MASPEQLATLFKRGLGAIQAATVRDAIRLWPILNLRAPGSTYAEWQAAMQALAVRNRAAATTLGTSYVGAAWLAAGQADAPTLVPASDLPVEQIQTALRVTSLVAYRRSLGAGLEPQQAEQSALVQVSGSIARAVADAAREAAAESTIASGGRWSRVTNPGACSFCRMLAGRGAIYRSETNFASHDHCGCSLISEFGVSGPVPYVPSAKNISDADRARVRAWLKANPDVA